MPVKYSDLGAAAALAATALLLAGCSADEGTRTAEVRVVEASGYQVESSPENAVKFFMNDTIFEGTVLEVREDVRAWDDLGDSGSPFEYVYTPVRMRVDEVAKGDVEAGATVTLRALGGTADGLRYEIRSTDKTEFEPGRSFMVFAGTHSATTSEAEPALTPNFLYVADGETFRDVTYGSATNGDAHSTTAEHMDNLIAEATRSETRS